MTRHRTRSPDDGPDRLCFQDVAVTLGSRPVLRGVSFEFGRGELVGMLGRNGAGKTTLLRVATRAISPDAGRIQLGGRELSAIPRRELSRRVAVVPQDTQVPFSFSVGELVLMGRAPYQLPFGFEGAEDLRIARRAMEQVGIAELADRSVFELSGGERQLTVFARALAQTSDFLLLDEPTAFLDLRHRIDLLRVVRGFVDRGGAALVVSHDLSLAARLCDRLVLLADGVVAAEGPPDAVLTPPVLARAFEIDCEVIRAADGSPVVVPRMAGASGSRPR